MAADASARTAPHDDPAADIETVGPAFAKAAGLRAWKDAPSFARDFLAQALEDYAADEAPELSAEDLACALARFWSSADTREADEDARVEIAPLTDAKGERLGYDVITAIQSDAPFLVDSLMGELAASGVAVRAMFHPLIAVGRDKTGKRVESEDRRESMIFVIVDPLPPQRRETVIEGLEGTLGDVAAAVADHGLMQDRMAEAMTSLKSCAPNVVDPEVLSENLEFLGWLNADNFVFLGARTYEFPRTGEGGYETEAPLVQAGDGLGILRDPERTVLRRASEPAVLTRQMKRQLGVSEPVTVAKANARSRVHRRAYMDYIGVKTYGADGKVSGEVRFVGLFTAEAYDRAVAQVPLLRRKVKNALDRAGKSPGSHNAKRLKNIVENYPRDELFQISEDELLKTALGVLHLLDRPRVKMFARKDPYDRFISVLVYIPRERFEAAVRERIGRILAEAYGGRLSAWYPQLSDAPLVRIHYIIGVEPGDHLEPDPAEVEARIVETARGWGERFEGAARKAGVDESQVAAISHRWAEAFSIGYRDRYDADEAIVDYQQLDQLIEAEGDHAVAVRAFRRPSDSPLQFHFKLYRRGDAAPLSDVLPILTDMGLKTLEEYGHQVTPAGGGAVHIHEFLMEDPRGESLVFEDIKTPFEQTFAAVWTGKTESDGFNRLVMELGIGWREAAVFRTLCRYRLQTGMDPSQAIQEEALRDHPVVSRAILSLFLCKFDPEGPKLERREADAEELVEKIEAGLRDVPSLDHDRALRRLARLVRALKRTNYFQLGEDGEPKPYISIKIASRELEDLPAPKPYREIFVWAPHVEGVHLRFGPVARGGLRWSDRRDDFRTEVLGLVKAQQVKNAVIVPVGSKGGFYPKCLPQIVREGGDREAVQAEAIRAYKTFLSGLLDLTDNLVKDKVVRPPQVIAWEGDDPYLVVAADKGTATFSDIANGISADYGFWLDDAFASGGSVGYDHKVMGITARGAWEAVKRHFREMGKDIQSEPFTVVGVGDMSGDVFGNGMLLSKSIQLVAAFDHRDIFVDPNPDPASSWKERDRMFALPRSSWQDYDKTKISKGGGVFPRTMKSIPISAEMKAALDIAEDELDPTALMRAILKAPAELLYLGGIGTYVKAPGESDLMVGDKANDALRVDAPELRVKVVGEGANLGLTQAGRIAFARNGGRINTDAIDNSAGVDSSDHEVNIKILTGGAIQSGALKGEDRNALLASMTEEVGEKVLAHNYDQTLAISLQERNAVVELDAQERFMRALEAEGKLNRKVEGLPSSAAVVELQANGQGLTRPEIAVLTAYSKLELSDDIVASSAPEDPFFERTLVGYFPDPLAKFEAEMKRHRLRRDIVATVLSNDIVNMAGATFPERLKASAECDDTCLVIAFEAARRVFRLDEAWDAVNALDLKIPADAQLALQKEIAAVLRRQTFWLARGKAQTRARGGKITVQGFIDAYRDAADTLRAAGGSVLSRFEQAKLDERAQALIDLGAPEDLARTVAMLKPLTATRDIADLARAHKWPEPEMARLYHQVGAAFDMDRLRSAAGSLASADHYERLAVRRLIEDLNNEQLVLTRAVAKASKVEAGKSEETAEHAVDSWIGERCELVEGVRRSVDEIEQSGHGWSFAKLTIANIVIREMAAQAG
ncbi:NAD-glutamate dehydrogenase [Brevundimonas lutea]|uniref:NAD-glutamate dehydrogenase n=1 Tax=Brevundimonas lutea TaxID=2293980 RepID=UPI000F04014D|nr:NAD-glutamate dehydrogenase [Brevundimonas lutea]